jgi:hypothetical protein
VDTDSFRLVPGAPFAYWVREEVRRLFVDQEPLEASGRIARRTNGTTDDNRWIRAAWETPVASVQELWSWVPHVKGGALSRRTTRMLILRFTGTAFARPTRGT